MVLACGSERGFQSVCNPREFPRGLPFHPKIPLNHTEPGEDNPKPRTLLVRGLDFAWQNKKWWMIPIVGLLILFGLLIAIGGSGVAPFIYSMR